MTKALDKIAVVAVVLGLFQGTAFSMFSEDKKQGQESIASPKQYVSVASQTDNTFEELRARDNKIMNDRIADMSYTIGKIWGHAVYTEWEVSQADLELLAGLLGCYNDSLNKIEKPSKDYARNLISRPIAEPTTPFLRVTQPRSSVHYYPSRYYYEDLTKVLKDTHPYDAANLVSTSMGNFYRHFNTIGTNGLPQSGAMELAFNEFQKTETRPSKTIAFQLNQLKEYREEEDKQTIRIMKKYKVLPAINSYYKYD